MVGANADSRRVSLLTSRTRPPGLTRLIGCFHCFLHCAKYAERFWHQHHKLWQFSHVVMGGNERENEEKDGKKRREKGRRKERRKKGKEERWARKRRGQREEDGQK